ncbi:hypothetical protein GQ600_15228 [Phytophthora cactorum]|nr:hypothetical protein GQ600_15228 [Phytophthora cactorum]
MAKSKRTATELRLRLASLKRTYGKAVKDFPRCYFGGSAPERCLLSSVDARRKVWSSGSAAVRRNGEPSGNAVVRRKVDAVAKQLGGAVTKQLGGALVKQLGGALVKQLGGAGVSRKVVEVAKQPGDVLEEQSASAAVELQAPSQLLAMPCSSLLPLPDAIRVSRRC